MPRVAEADRKRARRPKSKTGCTTCKIRRVKCDETKPECFRCTSTGRRCDGYNGVLPSSQDPWTKATPPTKAVTPITKTSRSISPVAIQPSSVFATDKERQAFSFFLARTSTQLAGFYTCEFWSCILPQAAHMDPGIRHAIMALSSVHRLYEETGDADRLSDTFGMQHYQLAIRRHIDDMRLFHPTTGGEGSIAASLAAGKGKDGLESYLASSMLFICIEMLQGHFVSAISLTKVAVRLFYEHIVPTVLPHPASSITTSPWPLAIFERLLARLQAKAIGLVGRTAVDVFISPRIQKLDKDNPPVPAKFASIEEARDFYDAFWWAQAFSSHDPDVHGAQDDLRNPVTRTRHWRVWHGWGQAFGALLADLDFNRLSQRERNAIAVLQVRRLQTRFSFEMVVRDELADCNPMLWDAYLAEFSETLDRLETVLRTQDDCDRVAAPPSPLSSAAATLRPPRHLFTLDFGLVAPLYEVARLCRDPHIRRRAIRLLRDHPMREGMWDSRLAARAAEAQMELEEGMAVAFLPEGRARVECAGDIPRDARIIVLLPDLQPGQRSARTWFSKLPAQSPTDDRPKEWHFEQVIEW